MSSWCLHGTCSSWISYYRILVGHRVAVSPPGVHVKIIESRSQVQGHEISLTGKVCEPLHALFLAKKNLFFSEKTKFWDECAGIFGHIAAMVVKGGEGWKIRVVACLLNGLQASNSSS